MGQSSLLILALQRLSYHHTLVLYFFSHFDAFIVFQTSRSFNLFFVSQFSDKRIHSTCMQATKLNDVKSFKGTALWMAPEVSFDLSFDD